ncbi:MAG TPA: DUF6152 family protein [Steroidobacteraceae bacterium]
MNDPTRSQFLVAAGSPKSKASQGGLLSGVAAAVIAMPSVAHHSFAMFDDTKTLTLQGAVKELQWTNPHCYLQVTVPAKTGDIEWSIEMHSPSAMYRLGWRPRSFKPGDKVTVAIDPLRDGNKGGRLRYAIDARGRTLGSDKSQAAAGPRS